jgi:hypothetical protein
VFNRLQFLRIKVTDEFDQSIIDIKGKPKKIKQALQALDLKFNGGK